MSDEELTKLAENPTVLKLHHLLHTKGEVSVGDLLQPLGVSWSAVSQEIAVLEAYGLIAPRRDAQTIYYRLTEHPFNAKLRERYAREA